MGSVLYQAVRLVFGTLYPAYFSFKAVKTKNVKDYVNWMTYWIVFAIVTITEEISDVLLSFWLPFYYELKILFLFWLLSPVTRGSTLIYRQVIHPLLLTREDDIDLLLSRWREQSYRLGVKYTKVAAEKLTKTVIETAIAGGGGLVDTLKQSYSLNDLREEEAEQYERSDLVQSWHPAMVPGRGRELRGEQRRARRHQTGSVMALTSDLPGEDVPRRRAASVKQKRPPAASSTARPSSMRRLPKSPTQEVHRRGSPARESDSGDSHTTTR